jgi:hypothetical protein
LLLSGDSAFVLSRIVPGDPLSLRVLLVRELRRRALLCDVEGTLERFLCAVAYHAVSWRGEPRLHRFLRDCLRETLETLLEEGAPARAPAGGAALHRDVFSVLAVPLGLDPGSVREACAAFNRRDRIDRELFVRIVLEGAAVDSVARERALSGLEVLRNLRRTIAALLAGIPALRAPGQNPLL